VIVGVLGAVVAYPLLFNLRLGPRPGPGLPRESREVLQDRFAQGDVIMCDAPWAVAWHTDRTAVWLCQNEDGFDKYVQRMGLPAALYLSPRLASYPPEEVGDWWPWIALTEGNYKGLVVDPALGGSQVLRVPRQRLALKAEGAR
jgi:hypothetical protein